MSKTIIAFLTLAIVVAHCHFLKGPQPNKPDHKREKRSCHACDDDGPRGPPPPPPSPPRGPPPPPFFRTRSWSGLSRSADGSQKGVFSSAAAAADLGSQNAGQSFAFGKRLASSSASSSASAGAGGHGHSSASCQAQSSAGHNKAGFGSQTGGGSGQQKFSSSGSYKQIPYSYQSGKHFEGHGGSPGGQGFVGQQQSQVGSGGSRGSSSSSSSTSAGAGGHGHSSASCQAQSSAGHRKTGFGSQTGGGSGQKKFSSSGSYKQSPYFYQSGKHFEGLVGSPGGQGFGGQQQSQGVSSTQQAGASGCSTCSKGNYALSNAKSHSGNAVAVSVGG